jgi:hypothetical protein
MNDSEFNFQQWETVMAAGIGVIDCSPARRYV